MKYLFYHRLLHLDRDDAIRYEQELDSEFLSDIDHKLHSVGRPIGTVGFPEILYSVVRHTKPQTVIETGVGAGLSTAFMLKALETNGEGHLISIDMPNYERVLSLQGKIAEPVAILPESEEPGFLIPRDLKKRWTFHSGKTQDILIDVLRKLEHIDVFFHDSEHTFENMIFEYDLSWPYIKEGGMLLSDNVNQNRAFFDFAREVGRKPVHFPISTLGGIRKEC
jgi:predicted O-methyltransferase YrrM